MKHGPKLTSRRLSAASTRGCKRLPEAALRTCQQHRELVTPRLIEVLEDAARLGKQGIVREGNAHFFAIFLVTEFEAKEALPVILELYALHDPVLEGAVGAVTEVPQRVLAVLAGDQPDLIEAMILNRDLDDYIRWGAASSLCQLVRDAMPRAEALERLTRQFRRAVEQRDPRGVTITANELCDLNPLEIKEEIKTAFEQGLVDESMLDWKDCEEEMLKPDQPGVCQQLRNLKPSAITDTVEELSGWYCFSEAARRAKETYERRQNSTTNRFPCSAVALRRFNRSTERKRASRLSATIRPTSAATIRALAAAARSSKSVACGLETMGECNSCRPSNPCGAMLDPDLTIGAIACRPSGPKAGECSCRRRFAEPHDCRKYSRTSPRHGGRRLPLRIAPRVRHAGPAARRFRSGRGGAARCVRVGGGAVAAGRRAGQSAGVAGFGRAIQGDRRDAAAGAVRCVAGGAGRAARTDARTQPRTHGRRASKTTGCG